VRIGITGHGQLGNEGAWAWVDETLDELLTTVTAPLLGVTTLAVGAEQRFARAVLRVGGRLHVVVPHAGWERGFAATELASYRALLAEARVEQLASVAAARSDEDARWEAGRRVVDLSDELVAVWDGAPARAYGDVADVVAYALETQVPLVQLNPLARTTQRLR